MKYEKGYDRRFTGELYGLSSWTVSFTGKPEDIDVES